MGGGVAVVLACAPVEEPAPQFRDPAVPLSGLSRFEVGAFAGTWTTVACIGICQTRERFVAQGPATMIRTEAAEAVPYEVIGPCALRSGADAGRKIVVMWVDTGFRTAAIGDADGRWAAILDRQGERATDRFTAARDILDFNGWDVSQLQEQVQ